MMDQYKNTHSLPWLGYEISKLEFDRAEMYMDYIEGIWQRIDEVGNGWFMYEMMDGGWVRCKPYPYRKYVKQVGIMKPSFSLKKTNVVSGE